MEDWWYEEMTSVPRHTRPDGQTLEKELDFMPEQGGLGRRQDPACPHMTQR